MNKKELIDMITLETSSERAQVALVVNNLLLNIKWSLKRGKSVKIKGFGSFVKTRRKARLGSNPQTKKKMMFKAKNWPKFIPSKNLKQAVK